MHRLDFAGPRTLRAVDAATARATTGASFPVSGNLAIVLIGDAAKIGEAVKKYGPVPRMPIAAPSYYPGNPQ
jgi:hypothetical protein